MATFENTSLGLRGVLLRNGEYVWLEPGEKLDMARAAVKLLPGGVVEQGVANALPPVSSPAVERTAEADGIMKTPITRGRGRKARA